MVVVVDRKIYFDMLLAGATNHWTNKKEPTPDRYVKLWTHAPRTFQFVLLLLIWYSIHTVQYSQLAFADLARAKGIEDYMLPCRPASTWETMHMFN